MAAAAEEHALDALDQLTCVLRVDVSLSEAAVAAGLSLLLGSAVRVSRFHKTRREQRRPLPLCRVAFDDSRQRELLLAHGVVLGGVLCRAEPGHSGPASAAALGRVHPPPAPAKVFRGDPKQRARALARSVRVHVTLTAAGTGTHAGAVVVRLALARGSSGRGAATATGLGRAPAVSLREVGTSARQVAWPLHAAATRDDVAEVSALLSAGAAAPTAAEPKGGAESRSTAATAVATAAATGATAATAATAAAAECLPCASPSAVVDPPKPNGATPLMLAAMHGATRATPTPTPTPTPYPLPPTPYPYPYPYPYP
jgi:hypothetical protein